MAKDFCTPIAFAAKDPETDDETTAGTEEDKTE